MKRALAERASKTGTSPEPPLAPVSSSAPLSGIYRPDPQSASDDSKHQQEQQRNNKRKKTTNSNNDGNLSDGSDEDDTASAYFLRFQNKALAAELYQLKHKLTAVEKDIDLWKTGGTEIRRGVEQVQREWRSAVATLCGILYSVGIMKQEFHPTRKHKSISKNDLAYTENNFSETPSSLLNSILNVASTFKTSSQSTIVVNAEVVDLQNFHALSQMLNTNRLSNLENHETKAPAPVTSSSSTELILQDGLTTWIENVALPSLIGSSSGNDDMNITENDVLNLSRLYRQVAAAQQNTTTLQAQMEVMVKERDEAKFQEKRVRRGLYRIAAGHLKVEDVMKEIEKDGGEDMMLLPDSDNDVPDPDVPVSVVSSNTAATLSSPVTAGPVVKLEEVPLPSIEVTKQLRDLEVVCECRNGRIKELVAERESLQKRINDLIFKSGYGKSTDNSAPISPATVKRSETYIEAALKLTTAKRKVSELSVELEEVRGHWATCKGECDLANKMMKELNEKHAKRWNSLTEETHDDENGEDASHTSDAFEGMFEDEITSSATTKSSKHFEKVVGLEHKLQQALEGVRQVEALRVALTEASKMNDCLQSQVSEWKSKYTTLSTRKSSSRDTASKAASTSSSKGDVNIERLRLDFRQCRKELSAANLARENYKTKNERLEKDRDYIMRTNVRLIKQSSEKEEMNTKSLSTILQLKNVADLRTQEVSLLEQKAKSAEQLALAARLVQHAKMKVERGVEKEAETQKKELQDKMKNLHGELDSVKAGKDQTEARLFQSKDQLKSAVKELEIVKIRCNELAGESSTSEGEINKLKESFAVAKKEAKEYLKKSKNLKDCKGHTDASLSTDQNEYISVLKKRLACAVCNDRDKEVILLRCRHMFCKHCIDENIKNRSRKCPACGQRFDTKDVGDIWLK